MNQSSRKLIIAALVATGMAAGGVALADHGKGKGGCRHGLHLSPLGGPGFHLFGERMAEHLGLDEQQRADIQAIRDAYRGEFETLHQAMRDNREALHAAADSGADAEVRRLAEAQGDYMAETIVLGIQMRSEIDALLTEEQRQAARERMQRFRERRKEFKERRFGDKQT